MRGKRKTKKEPINELKELRGKIVELNKVASDHKKIGEEELKKLGHEKTLVLDNTNEIIAYHDTDHNILWANKAYLKSTGLSLSKIKGKKCYKAWDLDRLCNDCPVTKAIKTGEPHEAESTPQNQKHWPSDQGFWMVRAAPVKDDNGNIVGAIEVASDITDHKKAEEELRYSEKKFRSVFESPLIGMLFWNANGNINDVNDAFLKMVGYTRDEILSGVVGWRDLTPPEFKEKDDKMLTKIAETGVRTPIEKECVRKNESRFPVLLGAVFLPGPKPSGVSFILDITERKKAEKKLKVLNEKLRRRTLKLEQSNKKLEQFAYVASHDLQEPLRMVDSYTQLLEERYKDQLDADAREFINYAVEGANGMRRLIKDLLSYSRIETRGKTLKPINSHAALGQALTNLSTMIEENHAIVTNDDLPVIMADETQLVQLFQNLISNGIKFQKKEQPRVHISVNKKDDRWLFSVTDNGIGFEDKYKDLVFILFQRLHPKEKYPGTGIGLAICKKIVERHNGRIWVDSEPGKGSTFHFTLPKGGNK
jgi:PAS domain S-box-containing protein